MISFSSLVLACSSAVGVFSTPTGELVQRDNFAPGGLEKRITATTEGTSNNYFFSFWTTGAGDVEYTNGHDGSYNIEWSECGNFVGGKGWEIGAYRTIGYSGAFSTDAAAYLSVYGWFFDPKTEYYIVESYGTRAPGSSAQTYEGGPYTTFDHKGSVYSDGDTYDIYLAVRHNIPPPNGGVPNLTQYWSVRRSKRTSGTVTTANHFNAWVSLGMNLYTWGYQIVATEGYHSGGSSSITVWETTISTNSTSTDSISHSSTSTKSVVPSSTSTNYPLATSIPTSTASDSSTSTNYPPAKSFPTKSISDSSTSANSFPTRSPTTNSPPTNPTSTNSTPANPNPTNSTLESTGVPLSVPQCPVHIPQKNQWW